MASGPTTSPGETGDAPENVRPWGRYDILDEGEGHKVKRISVLPGKRLSYQRHGKRGEYWVVISGRGLVTIDGRPQEKGKGGTVHVPVGAKHRIENVGEGPLVFVEVQIGDYLGEDDIERLEDDFGRA